MNMWSGPAGFQTDTSGWSKFNSSSSSSSGGNYKPVNLGGNTGGGMQRPPPTAPGVTPYTFTPVQQVEFKDAPALPGIGGQLDQLQKDYRGINKAYNTDSYINNLNDLRELNLTTGLQGANSAAMAASTNAGQQGGAAASSALRAQLLLPFLQQNSELATQGEGFKAEASQKASAAHAAISSTMGSLQNSYLSTLASYNAANASNRLGTQQLNAQIGQDNNQGLLAGQQFNAGQNQFNANFNLSRSNFFENRRQFNTTQNFAQRQAQDAQRRFQATFEQQQYQQQNSQSQFEQQLDWDKDKFSQSLAAQQQAELYRRQQYQQQQNSPTSALPPVGNIPYDSWSGSQAAINNQTWNDNQNLNYPNNTRFPIYQSAVGSPKPIGVPSPWINSGSSFGGVY